jgi:hypothetical protein
MVEFLLAGVHRPTAASPVVPLAMSHGPQQHLFP